MPRLKLDYPGRVVKQMVGMNLTSGSKQLSQEPDLILCAHKEMVEVEEGNPRYYFTIARDKHRGRSKHTAAKYLYACFPFNDIGTLPFDIGKVRTNIIRPGADVSNGGKDTTDWAD